MRASYPVIIGFYLGYSVELRYPDRIWLDLSHYPHLGILCLIGLSFLTGLAEQAQ